MGTKDPKPIFTLGQGARTLPEFLQILERFKVQCLVDVRSKPYAKYRPEFSKKPLEEVITREGIQYLYMGHILGGEPEDESCYFNGKADYDRMEQQSSYLNGIQKLIALYQEGISLCLMCGEQKPELCHRSKLIGRTLEREGIAVFHIDEKDTLCSQSQVIDRLTGGQMHLFEPSLISKKKMKK